MCKSLSYLYTGTLGYIIAVASSLPPRGEDLKKRGWKEISHPAQAAHGVHTYEDPNTGLRVRFDEPQPGAPGFGGQPHYHILNPNATSSKDLYLDKKGNPVPKNSRLSHILPSQ